MITSSTSLENDFAESFEAMGYLVHQVAVSKGWWEEERNPGEMIALMHSELSEALEGLRKGNPPDEHLPEFKSVEVELADCIIRIMDFAARWGLRVGDALVSKHAFNATRPYKHGKVF
jgi:NTP pyrophosphatase (non-canonical NTP hydrolase)